jgi:hypothetical protein
MPDTLTTEEFRQNMEQDIIICFKYHNRLRFVVVFEMTVKDGICTHIKGVEKNSETDAIKTYLTEKMTDVHVTGVRSPREV